MQCYVSPISKPLALALLPVIAAPFVVVPFAVLAVLTGSGPVIAAAIAPPTTTDGLAGGQGPTGRPPSPAALAEIPPAMLALYLGAGPFCPGLPWSVLAAIGRIESDHNRNPATSSAGARGPMQFLPSTWAVYGVDGDGDGVADIMSPADAIPSAARYLCANGGGQIATLPSAIWNYNHDPNYVALVLATASAYEARA